MHLPSLPVPGRLYLDHSLFPFLSPLCVPFVPLEFSISWFQPLLPFHLSFIPFSISPSSSHYEGAAVWLPRSGDHPPGVIVPHLPLYLETPSRASLEPFHCVGDFFHIFYEFND